MHVLGEARTPAREAPVEPEVLVVDDEPDLVATYRRLLRRHGLQVVSASSRAQALATLPRLLIVDVGLPDGDGLDVVRAVRALPTPTPVIVITAMTSTTMREAAMSAGASAFISKPFSTEALSNLVRSILDSDGPDAAKRASTRA